MCTKAKQLLQSFFRRAGYEVRKVPGAVEPQYRQVTLGQLASLEFGEITIEEARFLGDLVRRAPADGPIIEVGTLFGWSTRIMAMAKPAGQLLLTVDNYEWNPWDLTVEQHKWLTGRLLSDAVAKLNVRQVTMDKNRFYAGYDGAPPAMIFLDAGHSYEETRRDLEFARRAGARLICGHDYHVKSWPGVVRAVEEFGGPRELVGSLWLLHDKRPA